MYYFWPPAHPGAGSPLLRGLAGGIHSGSRAPIKGIGAQTRRFARDDMKLNFAS